MALIYGELRQGNPTARISTYPASNLRDTDYGWHKNPETGEPEYRKGDDASRFGKRVQRERTRIRVGRTTQYVATAGRAGVPRPGEKWIDPTIEGPRTPDNPNADKRRGAFSVMLDGVLSGAIPLDSLDARTRRNVTRTIARMES